MSWIDNDGPLLSFERLSRSYRQCPTCQGTGSVVTSPGLVALIPLDDHRLKRRYTLLWILLTVAFSVFLGSIIVAVLLPRTVRLSTVNPLVIDATNHSSRNATDYHLTFTHQVSIRSENWVPIRLMNMTTVVEHQLMPIGPAAQKNYSRQLYLRPLGTFQSNVSIELDFHSDTMAYRVCQGTYRQMLLLKLQTMLIYADFLVGRVQSINNVAYQYVLCNREEWYSHVYRSKKEHE